jgi:hypothetical protein
MIEVPFLRTLAGWDFAPPATIACGGGFLSRFKMTSHLKTAQIL